MVHPQNMSATPVVVIESDAPVARYWRDLWRYRELFAFLTLRDVMVRYKQTAMGLLWAVLRPLATMMIFTLIFSRIAKLPSEGDVPYALMVLAALMPWQVFANALQDSSNSLVNNADMVSKIYFPRMVLPMSAVVVSLIDFAVALVIFAVLMAWFGLAPSWHIVFLPVFLLMVLMLTLGAGLIFSSLNVSYRDFRHMMPFVVRFGLYVSPVGFSIAAVPEAWRWLYAMNPLVGIIDGFRWSLLGHGVPLYLPAVLYSAAVSVVMLVAGVMVFRRLERTFVDRI